MEENKRFLEIFAKKKPIMAMLHLKGATDAEIFERAKREYDMYVNGGVDAVIVENYYGTYSNMVQMLDYVREQKAIPYGVNCLNSDPMGFELAESFDASFVQLDSVVGHVEPRDEDTLTSFFGLYRGRYHGCVLGGVRFKYQPVKSQNTLAVDLHIAKTRCDAVCVTQDATGQETSMEKIREFRDGLGEFPLIVGAGVTPENVRESFAVADGAIVGSYFKDTYKDTGDVCLEHVQALMKAVEEIRGELA